jgi:hypothetical protein
MQPQDANAEVANTCPAFSLTKGNYEKSDPKIKFKVEFLLMSWQ